MLNTLPPSVVPVTPLPPILPRRRGAPPFNRNAFKHGLYAQGNRRSYSGISTTTLYYPQLLDKTLEAIARAIPEIQEKLLLVLQLTRKNRGFSSSITWLRHGTILVNALLRLRVTRFKLLQPIRYLDFVAQHAHSLIRYDFHSQGITRDADLFLETCELSDFNSPPSREPQGSSRLDPLGRFLSSLQWAVIEPLLPPPDRTGGPGRPPADPRQLLDAIFWKFAHHARWQDLPTGCPPMLTCRRFHRRLFLSGRLATLYSALYKDLCTRGKADLAAFAEQGFFTISGKQVVLHPDLDETWQFRTALLFMQQGYQVLRRHFGRKGRNSYEM